MKLKLWHKVLLPVITSMALITGALAVISTIMQEQSIIREEDQRLDTAFLSFQHQIEESSELALSLATQISNEAEVQEAAADQDREALMAQLLPAFELLQAEFGIKQGHFHNPETVTILRLHKPEDYGDDLAGVREMPVEVNASRQSLHGIEIGRNGLGIRGMVPIHYEGRHVGAFEIGVNLDQELLEHIQQVNGGEWRLLLSPETASVITNVGYELKPVDNSALPGYVVYASTTDRFVTTRAASYTQVVNERATLIERIEVEGQHFVILSGPLQDYQGDIIGIVQVAYPRTEAIAMIARGRQQAVAVGLAITLISAGAVGLLVHLALKPVSALTAATHRIADGDLSVPLMISGDDEIGDLATSFQSMVGKLRESFAALNQRMDELAIARQQAQEGNRLKSEFLATMSHELRTPLNAMIGFTEIMLSGMGGVLDEDAQHMTERIHANSQRLLALINNVLDLSKIEARRVEIIARPFSPRKLAENLYQHTQSLAAKKGLEFEYHLDPNLPPKLMGDEGIIERIALNLLSNAFKFTERGRVSFTLTRNGHDGLWEMSVSDTGIGIPPHALEYIFDPFRQVDGSSQRAYGGSGLGLAIVRELVRAMDGSIHVESTLGAGSTFTVQLPLVEAEHQELIREFA